METLDKKEKNTHHGHAVKRFRHTLGIKQDSLSIDMGISQAMISMYESKKIIENDMTEKFAKALEEDPVTVIIENNNYENNKDTAIATGYIAGDNIVNNNPIEKIAELFERLSEKEQEKIILLEKLLKGK
jgi:transcriptional regulator with XRE-family HTH domain